MSATDPQASIVGAVRITRLIPINPGHKFNLVLSRNRWHTFFFLHYLNQMIPYLCVPRIFIPLNAASTMMQHLALFHQPKGHVAHMRMHFSSSFCTLAVKYEVWWLPFSLLLGSYELLSQPVMDSNGQCKFHQGPSSKSQQTPAETRSLLLWLSFVNSGKCGYVVPSAILTFLTPFQSASPHIKHI